MSNSLGDAFETRAQAFLTRRGWRLLARNYRCREGEIDLIMRDRGGVLVFVEVRARRDQRFGGACASITVEKRRRLVQAARHYLMTRPGGPCRFDVVAFDGPEQTLSWVRNAFDAD